MKRLLCPIRYNDQKQYYIYKRYVDLMQSVNYEIIFINPCSLSYLDDVIHLYDGLFLTGGRDIDPIYYNQTLHPKTNKELNSIDHFEIILIKLFYQLNKPIIGICRGIQTINVAFDGTLKQHIENHNNTTHLINTVPNTLLYKKSNNDVLVNSYHHQVIDKLGKNLKVSAYSIDGYIEAIEGNNLFACQWHPDLQQGKKEIFLSIITTLLK